MIELLRTIASPEKQLAFQESVPAANVADELVCMWFDDFHPASDLFVEAFSGKEIAPMEWFTRVFDKYVSSLPDNLEDMLKSPEWELVMRQARLTLQANGWAE